MRKEFIDKIPEKYLAPLWRSEGDDKLFRLNDYKGALEAYEKAIALLDKAPSLYGIAQPDNIYYGAAVSAIYLGEKDKATKYTEEFETMVDYRIQDPKMPSDSDSEKLNWLKNQLGNKSL